MRRNSKHTHTYAHTDTQPSLLMVNLIFTAMKDVSRSDRLVLMLNKFWVFFFSHRGNNGRILPPLATTLLMRHALMRPPQEFSLPVCARALLQVRQRLPTVVAWRSCIMATSFWRHFLYLHMLCVYNRISWCSWPSDSVREFSKSDKLADFDHQRSASPASVSRGFLVFVIKEAAEGKQRASESFIQTYTAMQEARQNMTVKE